MIELKRTAMLFACFLFFMNLAAVTCQELQTDVPVHDPVMIRQGGTYYIFCTGKGIAEWSSSDRVHWKKEKQVFENAPLWTKTVVPDFDNHIWAPDISFYKGYYYLYYSVSSFGKNTSAIGLAINSTLNTHDSAYRWVDKGLVIQSRPGTDNWNAIDPNLITDKDGTPWLAFGSFWSGLKMIRLMPDRFHRAQPLTEPVSLASRQRNEAESLPAVQGNPEQAGGNAIEAPFIYRKGKFFYLFASIDYCCKGPLSTYKMITGRSARLTGPYVDEHGVEMKRGGGTLLLAGDRNWYGVGHNAVCKFDGAEYLIFHAYDAADKGRSKLRIEKLNWKHGWPVVDLPGLHNLQ